MSRAVPFILPAALLLLWAGVAAVGMVDPLFLPSPWAVAVALFGGLSDGSLVRHAGVTLARALAGFGVAAIVGIPLGLLIGRVPVLMRATQPTVDFFRSIPATALFPLFLLFLGIGDLSRIAVVLYACSLIVLLNTAYGAMQVKELRIRAARTMNADGWTIFWKIIVPESMPGIFTGLRVSVSLAFVLIVVTEMFIGTSVGLGYQIKDAQEVYRTADMYAAILLTGMIGYMSNHGIWLLERRTLHWVGQ